MVETAKKILDWSEVWALLIPLSVLLIKRKQPSFFKPIIIYLWLALIMNLLIDVGYIYKTRVPDWIYPNNYLYNIHSIVRFICFSSFFIKLNQPFRRGVKKALPPISLVIIIINFFFENFFRVDSFSSHLLAFESALLLFYCLLYYLYKIHEENTTDKRPPDFWVVMGLSIYVVFNFIYFLSYTTLLERKHVHFVVVMWNFHNLTYIILCIFIAKAFYATRYR